MGSNYLIFTYSLDELGDMQNHSPNLELNFKMSVNDLAWANDLALESVLKSKQLANVYTFDGHSLVLTASIWRNRHYSVSKKLGRNGETIQLDLTEAIKQSQIFWSDIDLVFKSMNLGIDICGHCEGYGQWGRGDNVFECKHCEGMGYVEATVGES